MNIYDVTIEEILSLTIPVSAKNATEAERIIERRYRNSVYILTADDFKGVDFKVKLKMGLVKSAHRHLRGLN